MSSRRRIVCLGAAAAAIGCLAAGPASVAAQGDAPRPDDRPPDSVTVVAGPDYEAGALRRWLLGGRYRDVWTVPVRVPVLDLDTLGGLTPTERGGGVQTSTLRFQAPDQREYNFRSVNKSYRHSVPDWARGTLLEWLRQDQTSAQHPGAALVATPLLDAVGILNPAPKLYVMPDDPRLGEYREEFAGMLGTIEIHPNEGEDDEPLFFDSPTIAGGDRVLEHLDEEPEHRVDAAAFLAERLVSIYLGDWDRHVGQYRFARYERDGVYRWVPVPEDRDYAFVYHDGLLTAAVRSAFTARLIRFKRDYPDLMAMLSNSQQLARRLLSDLDRAAWDSVAHAVHDRLTDDAIARAVAAQPPAWRDRTADELAAALRARRDDFLTMSDRLYALLAMAPEIHGTEEDEVAVIERHPDAAVTVSLFAPGNEAWGDEPYYRRRFEPGETQDIRVFLSEGDDRAVVRGARNERIVIRVVGGEGDDVLTDSTGAAVVLYDAHGDNRLSGGPGTRIDRREHEPPEEEFSVLPNTPRDWGSSGSWFMPAAAWYPDVGLMVGGGPSRTWYGFRHHPYDDQHGLTALVNPGSWRGDLTYTATFQAESSGRRTRLAARASNVDVLRFHGLGNASPRIPDDSALTWLRRYRADASWLVPVTGASALTVGPAVRYTEAELESGTALDAARPTGSLGAGEAGLEAGFALDTRDHAAFPRHGLRAGIGLGGWVPLRDAPDPFATARADAAAFLSIQGVPAILAFRAGGETALGDVIPVYAAPAVGGRDDLRGFSQDRFIGDMAAHGTAELRLPVTPAKLVARGTLGVSAFGDAGRVWVDRASPGGWHTSMGAAVWFTTPLATVALEYADGEKRNVYLRLGMGF